LFAATAAILGLVVGAVIGAASTSHSSEIASLRRQVSSLGTKLSVAQDNLTSASNAAATARSQAANARAAAASAKTTADAQAKAQYASRMAAANSLLHRLRQEQGIQESSTISQDGVYVVGKDIPAGTYHTSGAGANASPGGACYFATLSSTNTQDILDNNNFNGPETVSLSGAYAFQISGPCTWARE
jgi:hypothetical protein